jgi:hypothetical protein
MVSEGNPRDQTQLLNSMNASEALASLVTDEDVPAIASLLADGQLEAARALRRLSGPAVREALLVPVRKGYSSRVLTQALARFGRDPEVQDAVVAYLEKFGSAFDFPAGDMAEFAGRAGIRAAVPVLNRLLDTVPAGSVARPMFAWALTSLHERAGVRGLVDVFSTTTPEQVDAWQRHAVGGALNRVVGERIYVGSADGRNEPHGNFEEAADRFRAWWNEVQETIHWDEKLIKWVW